MYVYHLAAKYMNTDNMLVDFSSIITVEEPITTSAVYKKVLDKIVSELPTELSVLEVRAFSFLHEVHA